MNHLVLRLSVGVGALWLACAGRASAQASAEQKPVVPAQCADVGAAFESLAQSVERAYQKLIASTQAEINASIAELASAKGAKKQELTRGIEANESELLSLRAQLGKAKSEIEKAKAKAQKACMAAVEGPPRKPSLADRCASPGAGNTASTHAHVRLTGESAGQRKKAAEVIARELGAKLVTTNLDKLVRGNPVETVTHIENLVSESDRASVVLLIEEKGDAPPARVAGRPMDLREPLLLFVNARLSKFRGIFLLGSNPGEQSSSPKLPRTAVINAATDGRALATMICRAPSAPPAKP
jgi:hypothetical protein